MANASGINPEAWFSWSIYMISVTWIIEGCSALIGNFIVLWLTITVENLKAISANWLLFSLALSDTAFALSNIAVGISMHFPFSSACALSGFTNIVTVFTSVFFPPLIAYCRYSGIYNDSDTHKKRFSPKNQILMNIAVYAISTGLTLPFLVSGHIGPVVQGICSLDFLNDLPFLLHYNVISVIILLTYVVVIAFYRKITKWVRGMQLLLIENPNPQTENTVRETNALLKVIRWLCILPLVLQSPILLLNTVLTVYSFPLPHWLGRFALLTWPGVTAIDPWITLLIIRPYRHALACSKLGKFSPCIKLNRVDPARSRIRNVTATPTSRKAENQEQKGSKRVVLQVAADVEAGSSRPTYPPNAIYIEDLNHT